MYYRRFDPSVNSIRRPGRSRHLELTSSLNRRSIVAHRDPRLESLERVAQQLIDCPRL